ncbi:MAG: AbrB/MazE/SpoVT family DNA-binding domain-containing protein [Nitrospinae bacterium]|nr:AbrB/MazE/SpoVT family DNA-binding domain-containing protein [Nitrospinota bacterium]
MKANIVSIGNSRGIRIPKSILEHCQIEKEVDLEVEGNKIIIFPSKEQPRKDWDKAFCEMAERGEDKLLIPDDVDMEFKEWEW